MAGVKDLQKTVEYTTDNPFTNPSPTWTEIPDCRIDDGGERPTDEPQEAPLKDGTPTSGGYLLSGSLFIRKTTTTPDSVISGLETADADCTRVWFRETDLQSSTVPQVIGGRKGAIVMVGQNNQGFGGHRVYNVMFNATEAETGKLIQDDPNYSASS